MYTGIVQVTAPVLSVASRPGYASIVVMNRNQIFDGAKAGVSVSINGTCLTVTHCDMESASFDISERTGEITTLKDVETGDIVNVERSHHMMAENGGHSLYGHVDGIAEIIGWENKGGSVQMALRVPPLSIRYFFPKGFIGLHGCSLTIDEIDEQDHLFTINLIPETLRMTNLSSQQVGDFLNYEVDQMTRTIVDTIRRVLPESAAR